MTQISRPFQIALLAMLVLAGVWFFALQGHATSGGSSPSASTSTPAAAPGSSNSAAAEEKAAGAPSGVYHGAAPGVEGLSRAIAKAHEAVATSQQNAKQLEEKSAQASSASSTGKVTGSSAPGSSSQTATKPTASKQAGSTASHPTATSAPAATKKAPSTSAATALTGPNRLPARQVLVEQELKQGAVVAVLFWNPKSSVDRAVQHELQLLLAVHHGIRPVRSSPVAQRLDKAVGLELDSKIAVQEARASQVASFGSITRAVQVLQTPTILIVNKSGQTTTLTGLADAFSIEQAIDEARHSA